MRSRIQLAGAVVAAAAAALVAAPPAAAQSTPATAAKSADIFPFAVHEKTLDNGLKVFAIPYDSPGTVAYFSVVRAGSRQEVEAGHSGFAHFFEHMMFRGTDKYPTDAYNDILKRMGADSNAFTTDDYTNFYIIGPSAQLETMMQIESDRFENLKYTEEAFRTEALAVLGEYNKNASSPFLPMYEKLRDLAFQKHTYKHTTMGFLADIQAMPQYYDYSLRFFDRFYRPENVVLLVVGDIDPDHVFSLAGKYYGDWKRGYKAAAIAAEPSQREEKTAELTWPNPTRPHLMMGWHVPAFDAASTETAALDVISQLVFAESAPLYQELVVDKQWVDQIDGDAPFRRDPYLFTVFARIKSDDLVPQVRQAVEKALTGLAEKPVDAARLERIKSHLRYDFALGLDSPGAVAFAAANMIDLTGGVEALNTLYRHYDAVTPADVQRVAGQIFKPTNETVVTLAYQPPKTDAAAPAAEGGMSR